MNACTIIFSIVIIILIGSKEKKKVDSINYLIVHVLGILILNSVIGSIITLMGY